MLNRHPDCIIPSTALHPYIMSTSWSQLSTRAVRSLTSGSCRTHSELALARRTLPTIYTRQQQRCLHVTPTQLAAPKSRDRGPASKEETQTDFAAMNVLGSMPPPTTAVDMCLDNGFALDSGLKISGAGVLLAAGEVFAWRPWTTNASGEATRLRNAKGQFQIQDQAWAILDLLWPKPDLLILGTGPTIAPLSPETRQRLNEMGIRVEVQDTRNAAAQFNLLATERSVQQIAAALVPIGWRDGR